MTEWGLIRILCIGLLNKHSVINTPFVAKWKCMYGVLLDKPHESLYRYILLSETTALDAENGMIRQSQLNPASSKNSWADTWEAVGCGVEGKRREILLVEPYREAFLRAGVTANRSHFTKALCWVGLTMQHMQNVNVYKVGFQWSSLLLFILGITSRETKLNIEVELLSTYTAIWGQQDFFKYHSARMH